MSEHEAVERDQPQQQQGFFNQLIAVAARVMLIYWAIKWFRGNSPTDQQSSQKNGGSLPTQTQSIWPLGSNLNLDICISESVESCDFLAASQLNGSFVLGGGDSATLSRNISLPVSERVKSNGSIYAHIAMYRNTLDSPSKIYTHPEDGVIIKTLLTKYRVKKDLVAKRNLISSRNETESEEFEKLVKKAEEEKNEPRQYVSYWSKNLTVHVIPEPTSIPMDQLRALPRMARHVVFTSKDMRNHYPIVFVNEFWDLSEDIYSFPINETVSELPLQIDFSPLSMWKFQFMMQMEESFNVQRSMMGIGEEEIDQLKRMFFETNPYLLAITFIVSLLHSVFDFLAFKNDVQFWRNRKSMEGLSLRTILLNISFQLIIFLYLLDNNTSWLIIISSGVGLLIEIWKVQKVVVCRVEKSPWFFNLIPYKLVIEDKAEQSELEKETDEYDKLAFKYLGIACFPLVIGYSIYSLMYESHKSWYSWVINTAVGFVYTFGFITMTPQLFINYKLKTVAHMPWKTFMYKALNTFIDDLFAFIIKMPTLHRLACFRDDLIFLIYLYQRWIYPVDKTRPNEYGQVAEDVVKNGEQQVVETSTSDEDKKNQ